MCGPCDASKERYEAAQCLLERLVSPEGYGIGPALKQVFKPAPLDDEWVQLAKRFDFG